MMSAAARAGVAMSWMNDVVRMAHTNSGMRCMVMPGVRMFRMVTRKLTEPRIDEVPRIITPTIHRLCPYGARMLSGGYAVQPESAAPPVKKPDRIMRAAGGIIQNERALILGKAISRAPIING